MRRFTALLVAVAGAAAVVIAASSMARAASACTSATVAQATGTEAPAGPTAGTTPEPPVVAPDFSQPPALRAAPLRGEIRLDGKLDEPDWRAAEPATAFTQIDPDEGCPASLRTEVRVLIGDDALYLGARMFDREPARIGARLARRDESSQADLFTVYIDSYHDHLSSFMFGVNAAGAIIDASIGSENQQDDSWDPVWAAEARVDSLGWCAEMRIPLSQLRYSPVGDGVWGLQLERFVYRKQERDLFAFTPKKERSGVNRYGHLIGMGRLAARRRLEILPYTLARSEHLDVEPGNPFRDGDDNFGAAGLDLKYGLTSNLTLDASVNPDFGQVEQDPAVVNLTAYEQLFEERRPFFVEGANLFGFGRTRSYNSVGSLRTFHSRRIGRAPQRDLSGDALQHVESPSQTTIAGAAKLTGKSRSGWSVGGLEAVTARERAEFVDTLGVRGRTPVEPRTNYLVARLRRDLRGGATVFGGLLTAVNRDLADAELRPLLRRSAYVGGIDWNHAWSDRHWALDGFVAGSTVAGSREVIASTQRSSARYFQRPDRRSAHYDPTRTHLEGFAGEVAMCRIAGRHWLGSLTYQTASPGFEVNDLGYQNRVDRQSMSSLVLYKEDKPGRLLRNWNAYAYQNHSFDFDGDNTFAQIAAAGDASFLNYWSLSWRAWYNPRTLDDRLTRGGPLAATPRGGSVSLDVETDSRRAYGASGEVSLDRRQNGGRENFYGLTLSLRPTPTLKIRVRPEVGSSTDPAQYVAAVADTLASGTFGGRYVFGTIHQESVSMETRLDWTLSPRLSLQLFVQPLVATGDYTDFKELRAPLTYDFDVYERDRGSVARDTSGGYVVDPDGAGPAVAFGFGNPNFNFRSLLGNAVLRWEYRPGSTLFFVWQQRRLDTEPNGDFRFRRDYEALFRRRADNVFAVKATYWLGG